MERDKADLEKTLLIERKGRVVREHGRLPYLVAFTGKDGWQRFKIGEKKMTLGRSSKADIVIGDDAISGTHCIIEYCDGDIIIEDQNSTNGTYVNGQEIKRAKVTTKSNLQMGRTVMKIEYKDESEIHLENELFRKATTDAMTGISNRDYFMRRAREEIAFAKRTDMPVGLVMLDIDFFKRVNDTFGHQAGDYVINQLAALINAEKRTEDLFGRYGGEEFIVLIRGKLNREGALSFCERARKTIENYDFQFDSKKISVTISLGLSLERGKRIESLDELIRRADLALHKAKENGRNRVESDCFGSLHKRMHKLKFWRVG